MHTQTRKPVETGLGSAIDEAVPLYLPEPLAASDYAAAWDLITDVVSSEIGPVPDLALIEPGVHLLELAAAYRVAHAAFEAAPEGEHMEPLRLLEIARCTLLSAALDIT